MNITFISFILCEHLVNFDDVFINYTCSTMFTSNTFSKCLFCKISTACIFDNMWPFTANLGLFYHLSLSSCPNFRFIGRRRANPALKLLRSIKFFSTLSIGFLTTQALSAGKVIFVVILLSNPTHLITIITIVTIIALIIIIITMVIGILRMRPGLARSSQLSSFSRQPLHSNTALCVVILCT